MKSALKKGYDYTGSKIVENPLFNKLLAGLLEFDPEKRMSPQEIMQSDFLMQKFEWISICPLFIINWGIIVKNFNN